MNNYAPVLIITLNRYEHFRRCVESLSACTDADKTDLNIALDYPTKDSHWEGYRKIEKYLENLQGFKSVNIIKRTENFGPAKNHLEAQSKIFEKYDRIIFSEDDNEFAPSFLDFVNNGLSTYENRQDVFSISGYNYPFPMPTWYRYDAYLVATFTAWGVGIWRNKWNKVDWSLNNFNDMLRKKENYRKLKRNYQRWLPQLLKIEDSGVITGDGLLLLYILDKNMYSVLPVKSRVRNTGHDGSGEHCGHSEIYLNQKIFEGFDDAYFPPDLKPDKNLLAFFSKQLQLSFIEKAKRLIPTPLRMLKRRIVGK